MKTSELASQRIAFEEEKLVQQTSATTVQDSEAELLRHKLKEQVRMFFQFEVNFFESCVCRC